MNFQSGSKENRRDKAIVERAKKMLVGRQEYAVFHDIYFEVAQSYAKSRGTNLNSEDIDVIHTSVSIDGKTYPLGFVKDIRGGTAFILEFS